MCFQFKHLGNEKSNRIIFVFADHNNPGMAGQSALGALLTSSKPPPLVSSPPMPVMSQAPTLESDMIMPESLMSLSPPSLSRPMGPVTPQTPVEKPLPPVTKFSLGDEFEDPPKMHPAPKPAPPGATVCKYFRI